jgi:hypothetical protein
MLLRSRKSPLRSVEKHSQDGAVELQIPFDFAQSRLSASLGMTKGRVALPCAFDADRPNRRWLHFAPPYFLSGLVASANFMHLSLRKGAHGDLSSAVWQEIRIASVGMTIHIWVRDRSAQEKLPSRKSHKFS